MISFYFLVFTFSVFLISLLLLSSTWRVEGTNKKEIKNNNDMEQSLFLVMLFYFSCMYIKWSYVFSTLGMRENMVLNEKTGVFTLSLSWEIYYYLFWMIPLFFHFVLVLVISQKISKGYYLNFTLLKKMMTFCEMLILTVTLLFFNQYIVFLCGVKMVDILFWVKLILNWMFMSYLFTLFIFFYYSMNDKFLSSSKLLLLFSFFVVLFIILNEGKIIKNFWFYFEYFMYMWFQDIFGFDYSLPFLLFYDIFYFLFINKILFGWYLNLILLMKIFVFFLQWIFPVAILILSVYNVYIVNIVNTQNKNSYSKNPLKKKNKKKKK